MPWETDNVVQFKNTKLDREKKILFITKWIRKPIICILKYHSTIVANQD